MSAAHIALSRFGYGLKHGNRAPSDPRRYLLRQLDTFDPKPAVISARKDTSAEAGLYMKLQQAAQKDQVMAKRMAEEGRPREPSALLEFPPEVRAAFQTATKTMIRDGGYRLDMAVSSNAPMVERLVHFWSNHFTASSAKAQTRHQIGNLEFGVIRPNVLGRFSDMLKEAALHPAMLIYLDQYQSIGPNSPLRKRIGRRGMNENLAREIFELHTLGVDGGYSQADVTEFARALTGWTIHGLPRLDRFSRLQPGGAAFAEAAHEPGTRQIMGRRYSQKGPQQALAILDDLATHPSTAKFVATKLARHFAGDDPPASIVARLEADFMRTGGNLESLTRTLIDSPECWVDRPVKFRQPFEWFVSVLRFTGDRKLNERQKFSMLRQLGQSSWRPASPAGYDDTEGSWAGPDALVRRVELAERIARGVNSDGVLARAATAFPDALSEHTRLSLRRAESDRQALALLLVSPEMLRR